MPSSARAQLALFLLWFCVSTAVEYALSCRVAAQPDHVRMTRARLEAWRFRPPPKESVHMYFSIWPLGMCAYNALCAALAAALMGTSAGRRLYAARAHAVTAAVFTLAFIAELPFAEWSVMRTYGLAQHERVRVSTTWLAIALVQLACACYLLRLRVRTHLALLGVRYAMLAAGTWLPVSPMSDHGAAETALVHGLAFAVAARWLVRSRGREFKAWRLTRAAAAALTAKKIAAAGGGDAGASGSGLHLS